MTRRLNVKNEDINQKLAPCGLNCSKCFAFNTGDIVQLSRKLRDALGSFDNYAKRFIDLLDEKTFIKYPEFKEMLNYFSLPKCRGCRIEKCKLFKECKVRECAKIHQVDYCFECTEYPCSNTGFDKNLYDRSIQINNRMKEIGVENYYEEIKDKYRY